MATHIRVLAILEIVYASIGICLALGMLALFGGVAALIGLSGGEGSFIASSLLAAVATITAGTIAVLSLPRLAAGIGLLRQARWARTLTIVVSVVGAFDVPVGLALGIYGLWVTCSRDGAAALRSTAAPLAIS